MWGGAPEGGMDAEAVTLVLLFGQAVVPQRHRVHLL